MISCSVEVMRPIELPGIEKAHNALPGSGSRAVLRCSPSAAELGGGRVE